MLTEAQKRLVQDSWALVAPIADQATLLFYGKLFELDPALRPLFPEDLTGQRTKLAQALGFAVGSLDRPEVLTPALQAMGRRHRDYGVQEGHYGTVGRALLWTLAEGLGPAFTPAHAEAWTATYTWVAATMKAA